MRASKSEGEPARDSRGGGTEGRGYKQKTVCYDEYRNTVYPQGG